MQFASNQVNCISGVMVSMLTLSAIDPDKIGICCFSSKHAALRRKSKDWLARNLDNMSAWTTYLSSVCCFSEFAL